ncbi:acyl-CoA dehydrogenase/oxidase [Hyaloraphidium curvatum]|nr:acyl-CoA dehydrogenase/oxidase [Hyaloraphidium curvatum]
MAELVVAAEGMKKVLKEFSRQEVAQHNKPDDCWIIVDSLVYNVSTFADLHPGGAGVIHDVAGKDATDVFYQLHRHSVLQKFGPRLLVGTVFNEKPKVVGEGDFSTVPYAEPSSIRPGWKESPYYKESHKALRLFTRKFVNEFVRAEAIEHEDLTNERPSPELWKRMADAGLLACRLGPGKHLSLGMKLPDCVKPSEFDYFHEMVVNEELSTLASRGYSDGLGGGFVIGLPTVLNFGQPELQKRIVPGIMKGDKFICLAISEAFAGSDVQGLQTRAVLSECGKFYIVNGTKKWITNGTFSDYFATACRTDKGLTMLLIERSFGGVETKPIKTSYSIAAGTAYVTFENVKVPVGNVLGKVNDGLKVVLSNFNHERWGMCVGSNRGARLVLEECIKWAMQRKVFGKPLMEQPVIRQKIGAMAAKIEADHALIEKITDQMNKMTYMEMSEHLAGPIALLKYEITRTAGFVADEAVQVFGGRALTKTGMGRTIEMWNRTYKFDAILGGSEEILCDLAVRQAMKKMPNARL